MIKQNEKISLDIKHFEILENINYETTVQLPALLKEKKHLKKLIKHETQIKNVDNIAELNYKLNDIRSKIKLISNKEINYYLDNSKYVFEYFENKKDISQNLNKKKIIDNFFSKCKSNNENIFNNQLYQYISTKHDSFIDISKYIFEKDICKVCKKGELINAEYDGLVICNHCGNSIKFLVNNDKSSYKEPPKEICSYAYQRINHFKEIIAQFQGKETTHISNEIITTIQNQIKKERLTLNQITTDNVKTILKKLNYSNLYEHIPLIKSKFGIKPPIMDQELENKLYMLFAYIQEPYAKYCPNTRINFLHYYYTLYKLCELLGQTQYLSEIPMLKDNVIKIQQDNIWKNICFELDWEFIPTI